MEQQKTRLESIDTDNTIRLPNEDELEAAPKESRDTNISEGDKSETEPNKERLLQKGYLTKPEMCLLWGCKSRKMDELIKQSKDRGDNPPYVELDSDRFLYEKLDPKKPQKIFRINPEK